MRHHGFRHISNNVITGSLLILLLILCTSVSYSQTQADFSGVWAQDITKSDDFYKEFNVTYTIKQTPQIITIKQTFSDKDGKEITSRESSFNLDGKEVSKEEQGGINKESAAWSADFISSGS